MNARGPRVSVAILGATGVTALEAVVTAPAATGGAL
jgi:hypothetical protein